MKKRASNNFLRKNSFKSNMTNFLSLFLILILYVNSLEEGKNDSMYKGNGFLLFLTKNVSLSCINTNKTWEVNLNEHIFFTKNINNNKITEDISFYMINNKSYIIKNNVLIPYNVFVCDLVNNNNYVYSDNNNDFFLKGKIINIYLIIDLNSGNILEKIRDINDDSSILKKLTLYKNTIILKSEEYHLEKVDKNTNKILMNMAISDIQILREEKKYNTEVYFDKEESLGKFIDELKIEINLDEIISIYNYSNGNINLLYNKNIFDKKIPNKSSNEKEIKDLIKENNSVLNKLFKYDIFNTILVITSTIILILLFKLFPKKPATTTNFNNIKIINKNYPSTNPNSTELYKFCPHVESVSINPTNNISIHNDENKNNQLVKYKENKILGLMKNKEKYFETLELSHSRSSNDLVGRKNAQLVQYKNKNNNFQIEQNNNLEILNKFILEGINEFDVEKIIKPIKNNIEIKGSNFNPITKEIFIKLEENTKNKITLRIPEKKFIKYKNILSKKNINLLLPQKEESISKSEKEIPQKGIWDESIDESLDTSVKEEDINKNLSVNKIDSNYDINEKIEQKEKESMISYNLNEKNVIRKVKSRLDLDFKNLEKIGEGGFGVVLKGVHRLDKGINAIKIIKLSSVNDKENIINEAITMTKISSKHIVQYKTCWIDNILGSASKFFDNDDEENEDESNIDNSNTNKNNLNIKNLSKSCSFVQKKNKDDKESISSDDSDENNYDCIALKRNVSKDLLKIKNNKDNNSQESKKRKNSNALTKYYNDFRDDSYMIKESNLSKQFNDDNNFNINASNSEYAINSHYAKYFFILMEYCDGLTLDNYIKQHANSKIDRKIIYSFTQQLLKSLIKIHSGGIIHRDIKPSNIFIKNDQIKIGDFGLATRYNTSKLLKAKKIEGTPLYLSPEQTSFKSYNEKVDIYACGITLYEMCCCFNSSMERYESINNLRNNEILEESVVKNYPEETELIKLMTKKDYNERPTANEILKSDLFINWGKKLGF